MSAHKQESINQNKPETLEDSFRGYMVYPASEMLLMENGWDFLLSERLSLNIIELLVASSVNPRVFHFSLAPNSTHQTCDVSGFSHEPPGLLVDGHDNSLYCPQHLSVEQAKRLMAKHNLGDK